MALTVRPLRVLVVDDEPIARRNLIVLLSRDPDIGAVGSPGEGRRAIFGRLPAGIPPARRFGASCDLVQ